MVEITNTELLYANEGIKILQNGIPTKSGGVTPPLKFSMDTALKLRRITREIKTLLGDYDEKRNEILGEHSEKDEAGQFKLKDGSVIFLSPEDKAAAEEKLDALGNVKVPFNEVLVPKDFVRKERDDTGKVYEVDDIEAFIVELLGPLLQEEEEK